MIGRRRGRLPAATSTPIILTRTPYGSEKPTSQSGSPYAAMTLPLRGGLNGRKVDQATDTYNTIEWLLKNVEGNNGRGDGQWFRENVLRPLWILHLKGEAPASPIPPALAFDTSLSKWRALQNWPADGAVATTRLHLPQDGGRGARH